MEETGDLRGRNLPSTDRAAEILAEREAGSRRLLYHASGWAHAVMLTTAYSVIIVGVGHGAGFLGMLLFTVPWVGDLSIPILAGQLGTFLLFASPLLPWLIGFRIFCGIGVLLQGLSLFLHWRSLSGSGDTFYWMMALPWCGIAANTGLRLFWKRLVSA